MPNSSPTGYLISVTDPVADPIPLHPGTRYRLGRAPTNRVVLMDDLCSREHAELFAAGGWVLRDLKSTNGCHVNEIPVTADVPLADGDVLRFGRTRFTLSLIHI